MPLWLSVASALLLLRAPAQAPRRVLPVHRLGAPRAAAPDAALPGVNAGIVEYEVDVLKPLGLQVRPGANVACDRRTRARAPSRLKRCTPCRPAPHTRSRTHSRLSQFEEQPGRGVVVSLAYAGGNGARQGIRAGDLVVATSASVGDAMWAKDTLAGVQTAISTRIGQSVRLRLQRRGDRDARPWEVPLNHTYEVELRQPLGLVLRQRGGVDDASQTAGWVEVAEVDPEGTAAASGMVRLGDAVVATSGTLGNSMWEKSSAEGVTAAIGTRFALSDTVRRDRRRDAAGMRPTIGRTHVHTHPGAAHTPGPHHLHRPKVPRQGTGREAPPIVRFDPGLNAQVRLRLRRTEAIGPWATELWQAGRGERDSLSPQALSAYRAQARALLSL